MQFISVIIAALACYAFGAVYYMSLSKQWMKAAGLSETDVNNGNKTPYIIAAIVALIATGMLRHILAMSGIEGVGKSALTGFGIGLFMIGGWIFLNNGYEGKPVQLSIINTGYASLGLAVSGAILGLF